MLTRVLLLHAYRIWKWEVIQSEHFDCSPKTRRALGASVMRISRIEVRRFALSFAEGEGKDTWSGFACCDTMRTDSNPDFVGEIQHRPRVFVPTHCD